MCYVSLDIYDIFGTFNMMLLIYFCPYILCRVGLGGGEGGYTKYFFVELFWRLTTKVYTANKCTYVDI